MAQTYRPIELVIVDDGSDIPVTLSLLEHECRETKCIVLHNTHNAGVSSARNLGIARSSGGFIAFLDDDDEWAPDKLTHQVRAIQKSSKKDIRGAYCNIAYVDQTGGTVGQSGFPEFASTLLQTIVYRDANLPPPTLLISRSALNEVGYFDESLPCFEDREWALRFLSRYDLVCVHSPPLVTVHDHPGDRLTLHSSKMLTGEMAFLRVIREYLSVHTEYDADRALAYRLAKLANEFMLSGDWMAGIKTFTDAAIRNPFEHRATLGLAAAMLGPAIYRRIVANRLRRVRLGLEPESAA